jgi:hypothetical protein
MNMGQRFMQLNNTFTVADDGTITLHVSQPPPTPNLITPGPVFAYVVIHGIPSNGTMAIVGNGQISTQTMFQASTLPASVLSKNNVTGSANPATTTTGAGSGAKKASSSVSTGVIIAATVGGVAAVAIAAVFASVLIARKRRAAAARETIIGGIQRSTSMGRGYRDAKVLSDPQPGFNEYSRGSPAGSGDAADAFIPLQQYSQADLHAASSSPSQVNLQQAGGYGGGYSDYSTPTPTQGGYSNQMQAGSPEGNRYQQRAGYGQGQGHPRYL